jgi:hypothetical protein
LSHLLYVWNFGGRGKERRVEGWKRGVDTTPLILDVLKINRGDESRCPSPCLVVGLEGKKMIMYKEIGNYILHLLNSILKKYYGKNRNNIKIQ